MGNGLEQWIFAHIVTGVRIADIAIEILGAAAATRQKAADWRDIALDVSALLHLRAKTESFRANLDYIHGYIEVGLIAV